MRCARTHTHTERNNDKLYTCIILPQCLGVGQQPSATEESLLACAVLSCHWDYGRPHQWGCFSALFPSTQVPHEAGPRGYHRGSDNTVDRMPPCFHRKDGILTVPSGRIVPCHIMPQNAACLRCINETIEKELPSNRLSTVEALTWLNVSCIMKVHLIPLCGTVISSLSTNSHTMPLCSIGKIF